MSATPESTLANPAQRIADLESQLAECKAELDKAQRNLNETTTERAEALARETATAEVLRVINSSPGDLAPVFDAILEKARTLCEGTFGALFLAEVDELFRAVAMRGGTAAWHERIRRGFAGSETPASAPLLAGERFVHIVDLAQIDHPMARAAVEAVGVRTFLSVPLRKDNTIVGMIFISRGEVRPFTDKQIALLQNFAAQAVIAMENARLLTETREALEQQTATAEVLGVINSSPGELKPVFDAILDKAHSLCGVEYGVLLTYDGELFWPVAMHGAPPSLEMRNGFRPSSGFRGLLRGERLLHIHDMAEVAAQRPDEPVYRDLFESGGILTQLAVPLRKDGRLLGIITANRREVKPFSDRQIALLENFAAQAVIAIENARLITETREALEQQTATAEVLQVINSSPDDLAPVFDAMLEKAMRLCGADFGVMNRYDGKHFYHAADNGVPSAYARYRRERGPITYGSGTTPARLVAGENLIHTADLMATEAYERGEPARRALVDLGGARTHLTAALRKGDVLLGDISIYRQEVRPFTDKQIALLQNFAAQAVIAMENARLLTETREALEQQTATAEVLQVINASPGDLAPVFDAILRNAHSLCDISHGSLQLYDGEKFRAVAVNGMADLADRLRQGYSLSPNNPLWPLLEGERFVHVPDLAEIDDPISRSAAEIGGTRTLLCVALRKDDKLLGQIAAARREVRPFSEKEISLLQNFAAQAVIAMENARLLTETREALEQQTATAEVLQVINSSPGALTPVFDAILEKARLACGAPHGDLWIRDGDMIQLAATHGDPGFAEWLWQHPRVPLWKGSPPERVILGEEYVQFDDAREDDSFRLVPEFLEQVERAGLRSTLLVPLRKEDAVLGVIVVYRCEVRRFTDKQIALLQNFAAQAVIAMDNARLLTETREALEQQTATAEVLGVINSSPGELAPVFDAILSKAQRMCSVDHAALELYDGERMHAVAVHGASDTFAETLRSGYPATDSPAARALLEGQRFAQIADAAEIDHIAFRTAAEVDGVRTVLFVPLRREDMFLGMIASARREVRLFSDKEIALLENFAAQAVIAMENARLLTETREALEQQTATAEVLQVINSSPGDLTPVFDAILEKAHRLCGAAHGGLVLYDGEYFRPGVSRGYPASLVERLRQGYRPAASHPMRRLLTGDPYVHVSDLAEVDDPAARSVVELGGIRTTLFVALRKDDELLGMFTAARDEVHPFSDKEITLLQNFAAQAVIAMDNARLLDEIRQRQAELRVTFDNMGDGVAMFDSELRLAAWNLNFQRILDVSDELLAERPNYSDYIRFLAQRGEFGNADIETELSRRLEAIGQELRFEHTRPDGRVIEVRRNAVPGGGFVIIYGDVTERKRAEAEIRDARDTAERALGELQTAQASLVHAQKMAALGQLTAGIAHEIKNPLNFVNNFAELSGELLLELKETTAPAVAALGDDERAAVAEVVEMLRGNLDKIAEHGKRADGIVKSMLEHSRGVSGERRVVDLNALIEEALNLAYHGARAQDASFNITLEREFDRGLAPTELAPQEMTRVFLNLFGNGFYATTRRQRDGAGPDFRPTLRVATRDLGDAVEVRVRDNGTGVAPEIRDKLFQPFVTTKPTGEGTGLGLSIAYDIVTQQHGGTISVDSQVGEFTEFTIRLPCA